MEKMPDVNIGVGETEEKKLVSHVEILEEFSEKALKDVLFLEKECFPKKWQYEDAEEYYAEMLKDKENINIFLKCGEKIGGYLLAVPFENVYEALKKYDLGLKLSKGDEKKIYLETIQILPKFRGLGGAEKLIVKMCEEGRKRGMKKFSIHARKLNGLNDKVEGMFTGRILKNRDLEKWYYGGDEPYKYMEIIIK